MSNPKRIMDNEYESIKNGIQETTDLINELLSVRRDDAYQAINKEIIRGRRTKYTKEILTYCLIAINEHFHGESPLGEREEKEIFGNCVDYYKINEFITFVRRQLSEVGIGITSESAVKIIEERMAWNIDQNTEIVNALAAYNIEKNNNVASEKKIKTLKREISEKTDQTVKMEKDLKKTQEGLKEKDCEIESWKQKVDEVTKERDMALKRADESDKEVMSRVIQERAEEARKKDPEHSKRVSQLGIKKRREHALKRTLVLQPIITKIKERGITSCSGIASELNRLGIPPLRGKAWYHTTVGKQLKRMKEEGTEKA